ncbi:MAG: SDR family NAD(P)-dependent oxidoreductase [Chloroflexales bacterium]|nr:SDR family NAD(P)-dependent oxidoreductase [Chloroflexales bacterium]
MSDLLSRPLAVVTGASSGIGYELAKQFAEHGFDLLITEHQEPTTEVRQVCETLGARVEVAQADLATYDGVEELCAKIAAAGRPVEAIALNAGVGIGGGFTYGTDLRDELNIINLNVVSTVHLAKRVLPAMVARAKGRMLFTSSIVSVIPGPFEAVYAASKAFVHSFAQALRNELKDTGVTVTSMMPGATDTNFFQRADMEDTRVGAGKKDDPAQVARQGFEALMAGEDHVVAGSLQTKLAAAVGGALPDTLKAEGHRFLNEPGSGKQQ